jgi:hypothetical protein
MTDQEKARAEKIVKEMSEASTSALIEVIATSIAALNIVEMNGGEEGAKKAIEEAKAYNDLGAIFGQAKEAADTCSTIEEWQEEMKWLRVTLAMAKKEIDRRLPR